MAIHTNILIVGAGPAGTTTALFLAKNGIKSTVIDRATFPRDKVCGESFDGHVTHTLRRLDPSILHEIRADVFLDCRNYSLINSKCKRVDVSFPQSATPRLLGRRLDVDNFMVEKIKDSPLIDFYENTAIKSYKKTTEGWEVITKSGETFKTKLLSWALGANNRMIDDLTYGKYRPKDEYLFARGYYSGIKKTQTGHAVEIFFVKKPIPICVVLCPVDEVLTNVEIGLNKLKAKKHNLNIRTLFPEVIQNHPELSQRFQHAKLEEKVKGVSMKLPSFKPRYSGEGYLLVGDSAASINPVTGYGVGHAMVQGELAAKTIAASLNAQDTSATFLKSFDKAVQQRLGKEILLGQWFTKSMRYIPLVDGMIAISGIQQMMEYILSDSNFAEKIMRPFSRLTPKVSET